MARSASAGPRPPRPPPPRTPRGGRGRRAPPNRHLLDASAVIETPEVPLVAAGGASASAAPPLGGGQSAAEVEAAVGRLWNRNRRRTTAGCAALRSCGRPRAGGARPRDRRERHAAARRRRRVPSVLAGMAVVRRDAVVRRLLVDQAVAAVAAELEPQTLHRHAKGAHKSRRAVRRRCTPQSPSSSCAAASRTASPSRSRPRERRRGRAKIECAANVPYYVHLIWQEDFTTNVFSRSKFIRADRVPAEAGDARMARPYRIEDGVVDAARGRTRAPRRACCPATR